MLEVVAHRITPVHIFFDCPLCNYIHTHGSRGDQSNRTEHRGSHCGNPNNMIKIIIDANTERYGFNSSPNDNNNDC